MLNLLKTNISYFWKQYLVFFLTLPLYSLFVISDKQILTGPEWEIDYWGGLFGLAIYLLYFIIVLKWIKEGRDRQMCILPLSIKQIAVARSILLIFPLIIMTLYLGVIHLGIISIWRQETESTILQTGFTSIIIMAVVLLWDQWFRNHSKNINSRILRAVITAGILLIYIISGYIILGTGGYHLLGYQTGKFIFVIQAVLIFPLLPLMFLKRGNYIQ